MTWAAAAAGFVSSVIVLKPRFGVQIAVVGAAAAGGGSQRRRSAGGGSSLWALLSDLHQVGWQ